MPSFATHAGIRAQLQRLAGESATIHPRVARGDANGHPAAGWYMTPRETRDGCECAHCAAARAGRHSFLGDHSHVAHPALAAYVEHLELEQ